MNQTNNTQVISCIDGSTLSEGVCDYAAWVAQQLSLPLTLLHTIEHNPTATVSDYSGAIGLGASDELLQELTDAEQNRAQLLIKKGNVMLNAAKSRVSSKPLAQVNCTQQHGSLTEALIDLEQTVEVAVMGIRGENHDQQSGETGAQLESVIRALHKPIMVVNNPFHQPAKIMLAYNASEASNKALDMIAKSNLFSGLECHIVHVADSSTKSEQLLQQATQRLESSDLKIEASLLSGKIEEALPQYQVQNNIDMMVMGAFSHNRIRDFLVGSFTAKMLARTKRPLLLLR